MPAMSKTSQRQLDAVTEPVDDMEPERRVVQGGVSQYPDIAGVTCRSSN